MHNRFGNVARYKINIPKTIEFVYTDNAIAEQKLEHQKHQIMGK